MRILRDWKALAFLGSTFGLGSLLLLALARPAGGRVDEVSQITLEVEDVTVTLTVLDRDDERSGPRARCEDDAPQRARLADVERLLAASPG